MSGLVNVFIDLDSEKRYARQQLAITKMHTMPGFSLDVAIARNSHGNYDRRFAHNMA